MNGHLELDSTTFSKVQRQRRRRNPLPGAPFFPVPIDLYNKGLVCCLTESELKRYLTLLRLGNYGYGNDMVIASLAQLKKLDGVSERAAWLVNRRLQEFGLIQVLKSRPFCYLLLRPKSWRPRVRRRIIIKRTKPLQVTVEQDREDKPYT